MTDADADALLRAIIAAPDDDTARLVYADWLQENGRAEEGEFIRTQCRLAATTPADPEHPTLTERDEELRLWLDSHAPGSHPSFGGGLFVDGGTRRWVRAHRGFPQFLSFEGDGRTGAKAVRALATALGRAFEALPTRWLVLSFVTAEQLGALLKNPILTGLTRLTVQLQPSSLDETNNATRALAACPHLRNLRGLCLASGFGDAACDALAAAPWGELEWFSSPCNDVSPAGFRTLAAAPWFRGLRELDLGYQFPASAFGVLCGLPPLPRLHSLGLTSSDFSVAGWDAFARSRTFPALAQLTCEHNNLTEGRFEALASATGFTLRVLKVSGSGFSPGATAALTTAPWAPTLRVLKLAWNRHSASDLKTVTGCQRLTSLQHLDLSYNPIGATALAALAANPALSGLRVLKLAEHETGPRRTLLPTHFDRFLARVNMPELRHLDLFGWPIGASAAKRFADPKFASLRRLGLRECKLTDAGVTKLLAAPALQNLIQLDLASNGLKTGPAPLSDPAVLPNLGSCWLTGNRIPPAVARKLRKRPAVSL